MGDNTSTSWWVHLYYHPANINGQNCSVLTNNLNLMSDMCEGWHTTVSYTTIFGFKTSSELCEKSVSKCFHIFMGQFIVYYVEPYSLKEDCQPYITCQVPFQFIFDEL